MKRRNTLGLVLVLIGIMWIIDLSGAININWVESLRKLWPVLLIAIGLSLMASKYKYVSVGVWVITFALFVAIGVSNENKSSNITKHITDNANKYVTQISKIPSTEEIPFDKENEEGKLTLNLGAVRLNIEKGSDDQLVKMHTSIDNIAHEYIEQKLSGGKQEAVLRYTHDEYKNNDISRDFKLELNPLIPWGVDANLAVVDGKIDFSKIPLEYLNLKLGAGALELSIGEQQVHTVMNIQAGATSLDIYIPENSGCMIKSENVFSNLSFHNIELTKHDDVYISENYENADNKIEIHIQSAISAIEIYAE
ncbi:MAG TPA: DUF5668 domain-containing protein [Thermoclostridium sp.]|nr:DUF5668 domain-containing protein [Thermoclostridium sp.]